METLPNMDRKEKLAFELDLRLSYIWSLVEREGGDLTTDQMSKLLRLTYAQGYMDALKEETPGQLLLDVPGYKISGRKR